MTNILEADETPRWGRLKTIAHYQNEPVLALVPGEGSPVEGRAIGLVAGRLVPLAPAYVDPSKWGSVAFKGENDQAIYNRVLWDEAYYISPSEVGTMSEGYSPLPDRELMRALGVVRAMEALAELDVIVRYTIAARHLRLRETTPSANEVRRWATTVPYVHSDGSKRFAGIEVGLVVETDEGWPMPLATACVYADIDGDDEDRGFAPVNDESDMADGIAEAWSEISSLNGVPAPELI